MDLGSDIGALVSNSDFASDWEKFIELLVQMFRAGLTEREIGAHLEGKEITWIAKVKKLNLEREHAQGIDLDMGTPKLTIDDGRYLRASHVVLHFRNDVPVSWDNCIEGSLIKFHANFGSNAGIRPAIGLSEFNNGNKVTLKLGLRNGEFIETLKESL